MTAEAADDGSGLLLAFGHGGHPLQGAVEAGGQPSPRGALDQQQASQGAQPLPQRLRLGRRLAARDQVQPNERLVAKAREPLDQSAEGIGFAVLGVFAEDQAAVGVELRKHVNQIRLFVERAVQLAV